MHQPVGVVRLQLAFDRDRAARLLLAVLNLAVLNEAALHAAEEPGTASRAVIGTLRPTERRRAANLRTFYTCTRKKMRVEIMELRGIEPLTSAVRLQRSPI